LNRRELLARGSSALLYLAAARSVRAQHEHRVPQFRSPLPIPPVLRPVRQDATTDYYEIAQREASAEIVPGTRTRIWGYEGMFPGPTIEARRGRKTVVTHTNRLAVPTVTHVHGAVTRPESDGFPTETVIPGQSRTYQYDNVGRPATLWYHDHGWRGTGRNLYMGLAGFYLLKEDSGIESLLPSGPYDLSLMLHDRALTADGELDYDHDGHHGALSRIMLVNGVAWPVLEVAARKYRFRILNASNATAMRLALSTHQPVIQIGTDQGLLAAPVILPTIGLAMAERVEVVIDFSLYPLGTQVVLENRRAQGPLRSVMRFDVVRAARDDSRIPERLGDFEPLHRSRSSRTRTFVFGGKPTFGVPPGVRWVVNGESFDPSRVDADPRLGDVEVWRFVNRAFLGNAMLHPVHTHLVPFQVIRRNGRAPLRQEAGWKDTVAIEDGEEVEVVMRWSGYRGRYLLHCHNLEHEDHSMMARVDVV